MTASIVAHGFVAQTQHNIPFMTMRQTDQVSNTAETNCSRTGRACSCASGSCRLAMPPKASICCRRSAVSSVYSCRQQPAQCLTHSIPINACCVGPAAMLSPCCADLMLSWLHAMLTPGYASWMLCWLCAVPIQGLLTCTVLCWTPMLYQACAVITRPAQVAQHSTSSPHTSCHSTAHHHLTQHAKAQHSTAPAQGLAGCRHPQQQR